MLSEKRYVAYCRTCQKPLNGELSTFHNSDNTWSFDLSDMSCDRSEFLYATYKDEFILDGIRQVEEEQDEAFDDIVLEHLATWTILESLNVEGASQPRI